MKTSLKLLLGIALLAGLSACPSGEGEKPTGEAGHESAAPAADASAAAPAGDASAAPAADASAAAPAGDAGHASAAPAASASAAH